MTEPHIRLLDDLGSEFARIAANQAATRRSRPRVGRRALAVALSVVVVLAGTASVVPGTRASIDDLIGSLAGGDDAPGRDVRPGDDAPDWVRERGSARLIAEAGGAGLYATRSVLPDGEVYLEFALGEGAGIGSTVAGWRQRFEGNSIVFLGPGLLKHGAACDIRGRFPLLGVTARSVDRVELRYTSGPTTTQHVDGGFVLMADTNRRLHDIVAYDTSGREVDTSDVSDIETTQRC